MRRTGLLSMTVVILMVLASGVALAATINGNNLDNKLVGTDKPDTMRGYDGADLMYGRGSRDLMHGGHGGDRMFGGSGADKVYAGAGNDYVSVINDNSGDFVDCGIGYDTVNEQTGNQGPDDVYVHCEHFDH
jgi:Ca2+-binding RTX toxin-like protein